MLLTHDPVHAGLDISMCTLRLLLIASSVFALRVLAYTNFSDFLCLHNCKTLGRIHMQALDAGITPCIVSHLNSKCQGPTHIRYIHYIRLYILCMRVRVPRSRVGPRLYLACFTPVAPVAYNIRPTSCPSSSCCVSLIPKLRENARGVSSNSFALLFYLSEIYFRRTIISAHII